MAATTILPKHSQILHEIEPTDLWAAQYNTWLLIESIAKGIASFLFNTGPEQGLVDVQVQQQLENEAQIGGQACRSCLVPHLHKSHRESLSAYLTITVFCLTNPPLCLTIASPCLTITAWCFTISHHVSPSLTVFHHPSLCFTVPHCIPPSLTLCHHASL